MADQKLTELTKVTTLGANSLLYAVDPNRTAGDQSVSIDPANIGGGSSETVAKTGSTLVFTEDAVYNESSPISGNITLDNTGQLSGTVVSCYHVSSTQPSVTLPGGTTLKINNDEYLADNVSVNVIYFISLPSGNYEASIKRYPEPYDSLLQATLNSALYNSDSIPSEASLTKINNLILGLKDIALDSDPMAKADITTSIDAIYVFRNSTRDFSKYNFKNATKELEEFGTGLTFDFRGFKGDGSASMLLAPPLSGLSNYAQDDASIFVSRELDASPVAGGYSAGVIEDGDTSRRLQIGGTQPSTMFLALNDNSNTTTVTLDSGSIMLDRASSANYNVYLDGSFDQTVTDTSTVVPTKTLGLLARNFGSGNVVTGPSNETLEVIIIGSSLRDYQSNINTLVNNTVLS